MTIKDQQGFTLFELILVLGLLSIASIFTFEQKQQELEAMKAKGTGELLFQYNNAVRSWLSNNVGAPAAIKHGTSWLKHTSCTGGTSTIAYLPCNFADATSVRPIPFGNINLTSYIESAGVHPNQVTSVRTDTSPFLVKNQPRASLAGIAAIVAAAGSTDGLTPVLMASEGSFTSNPSTASITMVASNNSSTDAWLRTDGSNFMNNNITFNPFRDPENREIRNISRLVNITDGVIFVGSAGGAALASPDKFIVDANEEILGVLKISNTKGNAVGLEVTKGNVNIPDGDLNASGHVVGQTFKDLNNDLYYVDPDKISVMNNIGATGDVLAEGRISGTLFYDAEDASFYVDPDKLSALNELSTKGNVKVGKYLELEEVSVEGQSCPGGITAGALSRDASGKLLSCQAGVWKGSSGVDILYSSTRASGGTYTFSTTSSALLIADSYAFYKTSSDKTPYATVTINGVTCSRDRGSESQTNRYASASCTRIVGPGTHTVNFGASYTQRSSVIAIGL